MIKTQTTPMTLEAWKAEVEKLEPEARYRENGAHGWQTLGFGENGPTLTQTTGPHWIDAVSPSKSSRGLRGLLVGTYDVKAWTGRVY